MAGASKPRRLRLAPATGRDTLREEIDGARSDDLVFAIVGYMGAGASWVAGQLTEVLSGQSYAPQLIRCSELIDAAVQSCDWYEGPAVPTSGRASTARTDSLQKAGDALCKRFGPGFVAGLAIRAIHKTREEYRSNTDAAQAAQVFIIDSLKRPAEVEALRDIYGNSFYLLSVVCEPETRRKRLKHKYKPRSSEELDALIARDRQEREKPYGQQVLKTLHLGDLFVRNEGPDEQLTDALTRVVEIVMRRNVIRPTRDERGMYAAWGASLRSACLSRQVGAAVIAPDGVLLATGTNDVPRAGGGLYQDEPEISGQDDHRCFRWDVGEGPGCRNDRTKEGMYADITAGLRAAGVLAVDASDEAVRACLKSSRVRDLTEFSRAVHAEMDALISIARRGGDSCIGATLYATTYPCHNCARHLVAAGIIDVVYLEPYSKSLAAELHSDSIRESGPLSGPAGTSSQREGSQHVTFRLFSGVAPRRFAQLFEKRQPLKDAEGRFTVPLPHSHKDSVFTKTHLQFEASLAARVSEELLQRPE